MSHLAYGAAESQNVLRTSLTHLCGPWCPRGLAQWPYITEGAQEWSSLSSGILSAPGWPSGGGEAEGALEGGGQGAAEGGHQEAQGGLDVQQREPSGTCGGRVWPRARITELRLDQNFRAFRIYINTCHCCI